MEDQNLGDIFRPGEGLRVAASNGRVALAFANVADGVPEPVTDHCEGMEGILRFAGGVSRVTTQDEEALFAHVRRAFYGIPLRNVALMSGGTRLLDANKRAICTVLELPYLVRRWHPGCRTLGSAPRTTITASLVGESRFIPKDVISSTITNPGQDLVWFVQLNAHTTTGYWGLDVPLYFDLFDIMRDANTAAGLWVWGGNTVTAHEISEALSRGYPCAVVRGSGGIADAVADWLLGESEVSAPNMQALVQGILETSADLRRIKVITEPDDTRRWLEQTGFTR